MDNTLLDEYFTYHSPAPAQLAKYDAVAPNGADQTAAIRKVREAVMTANAAIALGGL